MRPSRYSEHRRLQTLLYSCGAVLFSHIEIAGLELEAQPPAIHLQGLEDLRPNAHERSEDDVAGIGVEVDQALDGVELKGADMLLVPIVPGCRVL